MGRHAGRSATTGPHTSQLTTSTATDLTPPPGSGSADPRSAGGSRLTPALGLAVGRRAHNVPAFGSPEHTALLSGSIAVGAVAAGPVAPATGQIRPTPVAAGSTLPGGPASAVAASRSRRAASPAPRLSRGPSAASFRSAGPAVRSGSVGARPTGRGRELPPPPVVAGPPTAGVTLPSAHPLPGQLLAARALVAEPTVVEDATPTGELVRPFIDQFDLPAPGEHVDVPPPVSVDVFQQAVREAAAERAAARPAAVRPDEARSDVPGATSSEATLALDAGAAPSVRTRRPATRRELRAKQREYDSPRAVAARRVAKGGVLAVTAMGVAAGVAPGALGSLGLSGVGGGPALNLFFGGGKSEPAAIPAMAGNMVMAAPRLRGLDASTTDAVSQELPNAGQKANSLVNDFTQDIDAQIRQQRQAANDRAARSAVRDPRGYARRLLADRGWGSDQFGCLDKLWTRESNWNYQAVNSSSGAYGIAQALPGTRMAEVADDWRSNPITQMKWGVNYIGDRYGTPCGAWAHSQQTGWY